MSIKKNTNNNVVQKVYNEAMKVAQNQGLELVDIEYVKEGGEWYLRVYIDREEGIDHEICGRYSDEFSIYLDREDPIPTSYYLEISSPGVERPLKTEEDFLRFAGEQIQVNLYSPLNGIKEYTGELIGFENQQIILMAEIKPKGKQKAKTNERKEIMIPIEQVGKAHLVAVF